MTPVLLFYAVRLSYIIRINKFYFHVKFAAFYVLPLDVTSMCCHRYVLPLDDTVFLKAGGVYPQW